jgi:hypothetical protein
MASHTVPLVPDILRRIRHRVNGAVRSLRSATAETDAPDVDDDTAPLGATASSLDGEPAGPAERYSPTDIVVEAGLTPDEYVLQALGNAGGRLWQQELITHTGWSAATVSRILQEMEDRGQVIRIWVGREKLVNLPESAPE